VSEPLLKVEHLKKYFPIRSGLLKRTTGHVKAVDDVSFEIDRGETLALIGESGSGKSTVARTVIGLTDATDGTIRFDGTDITNPSSSRARTLHSQIQMVFQDPTSSLNPRRTVGKSVAVPLQSMGLSGAERRERVRELLERVDLNAEYLNRYPHELSGGQKQRVNIARAIAVEPDLLLLDEPTSALDVSVQAKIVRLLDDLQTEFDLTYLFITHDLSLVRNVADETAVMYLGQIQETGRTADVFQRPTHPYSRALLSAIPVTSSEEEAFKPRKEPLEGEIPSPKDVPPGCRFHTRCPFAVAQCQNIHPSMVPVGGQSSRCLIYDDEYAAAFDETPDVGDGPRESQHSQ